MSLIHEALKKAQDKEKAPIGSGLSGFSEPPREKRFALTKRTIVLIALVVVALGFLAYKRFSKPSSAPQPDAPAVAQPKLSTPAVPQQPSSPDDALLMKRRAIEAFKNDELNSALASITSAAQLAPEDPEVWNNKGLIEKKLGDMEEARKSYVKALDLKADYPEATNNLAMLEYAEGNPSRARELLQKALASEPAYPEANFNLGLIYDKGGDKQKAVEYYKRFLDVSGAFPNTVVEGVRDRVMEIDR